MVDISVIIVNWNGKHYLETCLESLRRQTFRGFETILVDNGSQDGSVEYVRSCFPEVQQIALSKNCGFTGANIAGWQQSSGKLIALLNNDTEASPNWLEEIRKASIAFQQASSFASKMLFSGDRQRIDNCGFDLTSAGLTIDLGRGEQDGPLWSAPRKVFGACGGAAVYRRNMLEDIGFLDDSFFMVYEDVDLAFRSQLRGGNCIFVPDAIVYHCLSATRKQDSSQNVFFSQRNIEFVYLKNMPLGLMFRSLPQRALYELGGALYFFKQGVGLAFMKAKLDALRQLPMVLQKRRLIHRRRTIANSQLHALMRHDWLSTKWKKLLSAWRGSTKTAVQPSRSSS
jgi:GT2 family glycosyltransferase